MTSPDLLGTDPSVSNVEPVPVPFETPDPVVPSTSTTLVDPHSVFPSVPGLGPLHGPNVGSLFCRFGKDFDPTEIRRNGVILGKETQPRKLEVNK